MFQRISFRYDLICLALLAIGATVPSGTAQADHDSFEHAGRCFNFPGEREIISALSNLEQARCHPAIARSFTRRAAWETGIALGRVCDRQTQYYLQGTLDHLERFACHGDPCDLNDAARLLQKALIAEQCHYGHDRPIVAPSPNYGGYRPAYGPGVGYAGGYAPRPTPNFGLSYDAGRGRGSVFIGGRDGGVHFKF